MVSRFVLFVSAAIATSVVVTTVMFVLSACIVRVLAPGLTGGALFAAVGIPTVVGTCVICWFAEPPVERFIDRVAPRSDRSGDGGPGRSAC